MIFYVFVFKLFDRVTQKASGWIRATNSGGVGLWGSQLLPADKHYVFTNE